MKKLLLLTIFILMISTVSAVNYYEVQGDSIFLVAVDWQKQDSTTYKAYITVDLNYGGISNPLRAHQAPVVEQYNWHNWWLDSLNFGTVGTMQTVYDELGNAVQYPRLDFYTEIPDINPGTISDYECQNYGVCDPSIPSTRAGYYGLPFYIKYLEFICDTTNPTSRKITKTPQGTETDVVTLTRPYYEGLPLPQIKVNTSIMPAGFISNPGQVVRYYALPVTCSGVTSNLNAKLNLVLRPNPLYRHYNPNVAGSETWEYSDIISSLPSIQNNQELPFGLDIRFDFSGQFWNYTMNDSQVADYYQTLFPGVEMSCVITSRLGFKTNVKSTELTAEQAQVINSEYETSDGESVECQYAPDTGVSQVGAHLGEDILSTIAVQQQEEVVLQKDLINKKLAIKKFMADSIIPFFGVLIIFIFYMFSLIALGVVVIGLFPMMFDQFVKGIKDAFNIEDLLKARRK